MQIEFNTNEYLKRKQAVENMLNTHCDTSLKDIFVRDDKTCGSRSSNNIYFEVGKNFDFFVEAQARDNLEMGEFRLVMKLHHELDELEQTFKELAEYEHQTEWHEFE